MKKHSLFVSLLAAGLTLFPLAASAQISLVNPVPQEVSTTNATFDAPKAWAVRTNMPASGFVAALAAKAPVAVDAKAKYTLTYGVKGQKAVKKYDNNVPAHKEAYFLEITAKGATVVGSDERGLYYGLQTLLQQMEKGKMQLCTVKDYPDVPFRGTVEGFYGTPWSHEARKSQLDFYGRHKMNVYIYGPKDDPYHRDRWREAYPEAEAKRLQELNEYAKQNGVNFYWAIHPGVDIKWNVDDRDKLMAKLEMMYRLGIRSFAVFFDDIWGEGTKADKQADLLNYIDNNFVQKKGDVAPLVMCPTEYNRAWANDAKGYLRTLGTKMNKSVEIMWTGNSVVHCIDKESMEWINSRIDRKAYIWWNFPVSDFVRDRILLGPAYGNDLDIAHMYSGFVSNPMEHAEASKIGLYGIADYTWNMKAYDYKADWEKAIQELLPDNAAALRTFALYNKDLGANGHGFRREEGEELQPIADAALSANLTTMEGAAALGQLEQKVNELGVACDVLLANKSNPELKRELKPWLLQGKNVAAYGNAVLQLKVLAAQAEAGQPAAAFPTFENVYAQARSIQEQMYELSNSDVRHRYQPAIKLGEKVLMPTLNKLFTQAVDAYNKKNGTQLVNTADYNPFKNSSDVQQLALLPINVRANEVSVSPALEVINWQAGGQLLLESDRPITFQGMDFNLGVQGAAKNFKLELFVDGEWKEVSILHYQDTDPVIHTGGELSGMQASKLRLVNKSGAEQKVYFKSFKFVKQ